MPAHPVAIISHTEVPAFECRILCLTCRQPLRFTTDRLYGKTLQSCECGTQVMPRTVMPRRDMRQKVELPPLVCPVCLGESLRDPQGRPRLTCGKQYCRSTFTKMNRESA